MQFEKRARVRVQLDMAPLIDVVFLLLIFFLLTSTYLVNESVDLVLPTSSTATPAPQLPIVVTLARDGAVGVGDEKLPLAAVAARVRELLAGDGRRAVRLKADAEVSVQRMLAVVDAVRAAGARELSLATRPGPAGQPGSPETGPQ